MQKLIPGSRRMILQNSGHAAMLETTVSVYQVLKRAGFLSQLRTPVFEAGNNSAAVNTGVQSSNGSVATDRAELQGVAMPAQRSTQPAVLGAQAANGAMQGSAGAVCSPRHRQGTWRRAHTCGCLCESHVSLCSGPGALCSAGTAQSTSSRREPSCWSSRAGHARHQNDKQTHERGCNS